MAGNDSDDFKQGYADGHKEESPAEAAAGILTAPLQTDEYRAGFEQGRSDRTQGQ